MPLRMENKKVSELEAKLMPGVAKRITDMIAALKNWQEFLNADRLRG